jgi:hypothetical protein
MPTRPTRLRAWHPSGLYRKQPTPAQEVAKATLREQLVADRGGPEVLTTAESLLIDLIVAAAVKHNDAISYLRTLPQPWVNRRSHVSWGIVRDTTSLASHLASLLDRLGYERRAQPVQDVRQMAGFDD